MRFNQITIVGVGLIGGSFALAARRAELAVKIKGYDDKAVIERARAAGVVDGYDSAFDESQETESDLIYLAAPVGGIIDFLRTRGRFIKPGAIVTDAGSTKREICRAARRSLSSETGFVGGHPMAGSHNTGFEFASADLFRGAPYAIVTDDALGDLTSPQREDVNAVIEVVRSIGGEPLTISAERHDHIVARVSHAPQLLSIALALSVAQGENESATKLAGSGFDDMTRLAASRWSVWEDICRTNADEIVEALKVVIQRIETLRDSISGGDLSHAKEAFAAANEFIERYRIRRKE
ncbi:MAG TPA: prephenate dehydrogenase/arogenate dehydrogenase family protein [Blastocatellia bacterium]|nr:prephenate dehydrogenase/arogenate dehydrogenase family protein [Blastocatellia bacterium]